MAAQTAQTVQRQYSPDRVPVTPLRDRYLQLRAQGRISERQAAIAAGYTIGGKADGRRFRRKLGIQPHTSGMKYADGTRRSYSYMQETLEYDEAVRLAQVLDLDPHEAGV